jgi:hypothetical protein
VTSLGHGPFGALRVTSILVLSAGWLAPGCAQEPAGPLRLETARVGADTRINLIAAPGYRINARLKPALELPGGRVIRLDSPYLTPDSAYFAEPPSALIPRRERTVGGRLRASVCDPGETVCRTVTLDL